MKTIVALSYFHRKNGPLVFYSYPKNILDKELSLKIANIMDQQFSEGFFTHSFENLKSMNYYFEIHSDWARGNKEMLMVSIILDPQIPTEVEEKISILCTKFSEQLQSNKEIYTAFYINDMNNFDENDQENIVKNESLINLWVTNLYWNIIEYTREKTEEEKIGFLLKDKHIFKTLEKLSKGPIPLKWLREWFIEKFPEKSFDEIIETLDDRQFIYFMIFFSAEKKIESIMKKESVNELTIARKYLPEIFSTDLLEISKDDGLPTLKPVLMEYFMFRGILTEIFGNIIKLKRIFKKLKLNSEQLEYLFSKYNLYQDARKVLEKVDKKKSINFKKLYADAIIREGNLFFNKKEYEKAARTYERAAEWANRELIENNLTNEAYRLAINSWISACQVQDAFRILQSLPNEKVRLILKESLDKISAAADYLLSINNLELARDQLYRAVNRYLMEDLFEELKHITEKLTEVLIFLFKQQVSEQKNLAAKNTYEELENLWDSYNVKKVNLDSTLEELINHFFEANNFKMAIVLIDKLNSRKLKRKLMQIKDGLVDKYNAN